jgi:DNA-binding transcriptional ArsR family regulator
LGVGTDFTAVGSLLSSSARVAMLGVLLDGSTASAGELAAAASVKPSTASAHLAALVDGRLIAMTAHGRNRYYRLAGGDVAHALEALAGICPETPTNSLRASRAKDALRSARTCYDHLAGQLGVEVLDVFLQRGWLVVRDDDYRLRPDGERRLVALGVDVDGARSARRHFARPCLDWTERRPHLAGALGAALCDSFFREGWVRRQRSGRGLAITALGATQLGAELGVTVATAA